MNYRVIYGVYNLFFRLFIKKFFLDGPGGRRSIFSEKNQVKNTGKSAYEIQLRIGRFFYHEKYHFLFIGNETMNKGNL
jgi:hypothetical protein